MRAAGLALISALALVACNQGGPGQATDSGVFPDLNGGSYRLEANMTHEAGTFPVVMIRDGQKQRVEMQTPMGPTTMIVNAATNEGYMLTNAAGRQMAMRMDLDDFEDPAKEWQTQFASTARRTGSCSAAGENGSEWTHEAEGQVNVVCVTNDGIILRSRSGDTATFEATRVQRGPQSADLFTLPAGVEVVDLGAALQGLQQNQDDLARRAREAMGQ